MKFLKIILFKNISTDFLKKTAINVDINYNKTEVGYNVILNTKIITPIYEFIKLHYYWLKLILG